MKTTKQKSLTDAQQIRLETQQIHAVADVIAVNFPDEKPSTADLIELNSDLINFELDDLMINKGWELFTHRGFKRKGGSTVHKSSVKTLEGKDLEDALVALFHDEKTDVKAKAPIVGYFKNNGYLNIDAGIRDRAWSRYTLEVEVANDDQNTTDLDNQTEGK